VSDAKVRAPLLELAGPHRRRVSINLKTAIAFGLTVPQPILARADEVIHQKVLCLPDTMHSREPKGT